MAYPLEIYLNLRSIPELEKRFTLLEPLVRVYLREHENIRRAMEDNEWGLAKLTEIQKELDDLKLDMTNIATAVELLRSEK